MPLRGGGVHTIASGRFLPFGIMLILSSERPLLIRADIARKHHLAIMGSSVPLMITIIVVGLLSRRAAGEETTRDFSTDLKPTIDI